MERMFAWLLLAFTVSSCFYTNIPPDPGTPVPPAHEGCFVFAGDTLVFSGDGERVAWHFTQEVEGISSQGEGRYVFQFGHQAWRYDAAEKLLVIPDGEKRKVLLLGSPASETVIELILHGELCQFNLVPNLH